MKIYHLLTSSTGTGTHHCLLHEADSLSLLSHSSLFDAIHKHTYGEILVHRRISSLWCIYCKIPSSIHPLLMTRVLRLCRMDQSTTMAHGMRNECVDEGCFFSYPLILYCMRYGTSGSSCRSCSPGIGFDHNLSYLAHESCVSFAGITCNGESRNIGYSLTWVMSELHL